MALDENESGIILLIRKQKQAYSHTLRHQTHMPSICLSILMGKFVLYTYSTHRIFEISHAEYTQQC